MTNILTPNQRQLLELLLEHNDSEKVKTAYAEILYDEEKKKYVGLAKGNEDVVTPQLAGMIAQQAENEAAKALPAIGDSIIAYGRSLGGRAKIIKKEQKG